MKNKNMGISLIVLVITIIVIIVLAAAIILTLNGNNPIENARQAAFLNDLGTFKSELEMYKTQEYATTQGEFSQKELFATQTNMTYGGKLQTGKTMFDAINSLKGMAKYDNKFEIIEGKLYYIGENSKESQWAPLADVELLNDQPIISITTLNTLPIKASVNATYSLGMLCGIPINNPTFNNTNVKVLNSLGAELGTQPTISGVVAGNENKKTAEITINTTGMTEGVYKIKVLANAVQTSTTGNEETVAVGNFEIDNTAPIMPSINITPTVLTSENVILTLSGKPDNTYKLEYSTDGTNWNIYTTQITIESNLTIHARITDLANNTSDESILEITNIDKTVPENATLNVSTNADKINGTLTLTDSGTGIELAQSKYMVTTQSTIYAVNATEWNTATAFSVNPQTISVTEPDGDYYVHTLSVDKVGNKKVNISGKVVVVNDGIVDPGYVASKGVNGPVLKKGMIPVKWSGTTMVETTANDNSWYDYTTKKWANAITKNSSNNITTYWVWIPRYEYKITTPHSSTAQTIAVNFINGITTTATSGYIMHPAFDFGGTQLTGIWVAKFEASGTTNSVDVIPNANSLRSITIDSMFTACRNMEINTVKYGWNTTDLDTHLIKNVEWAGVAYLSRSIYGNDNEISSNSSYSTGSGPYTMYPDQSTTGNVYGIYDMSGCSYECTAGYVNNGNASLMTYGSSLYNALAKYKDVYESSGDTRAGNYNVNSSKLGHAIYETSTSYTGGTSWYGDYSNTPYSNYPFLLRGGNYANSSYSGIFAFEDTGGYSDSSCGFRPCLILGIGL